MMQIEKDSEWNPYAKYEDEIESLRQQLAECQKDGRHYAHEYLIAKDALAECERDAKRYRWVREHCELIEYAEVAVQEDQDNLDAAIDAALAKLGADKTGDGS